MFGHEYRALRGAIGVLLLAAVACSEAPTNPGGDAGLQPAFALGDVLTVTSASGGTEIGSLRWVVSQAQGGEVIRFDPSLAGQTIVLDTTLSIRGKPLTIEGPADARVTISGGGRNRVMHLDPGLPGDSIVLRNLTIADGYAGSDGAAAGILQSGYSSAKVRIENSTLTGHVAGSSAVMHALKAVLVNSTVSGNTVLSPTGGPNVFAHDLTLDNSTVAHNTGSGVGVLLLMRNSIIADNTDRNCTNGIVSIVKEGGNVSDDDTCGTVFDMTIADPVLGPLADNGGPGMTHALLAGSPAINEGVACVVTTDQRNAPRDAACDIGAFEFVDFTTVDLAVAPSATFTSNGWAVLNGSVQCSRGETFELYVTLQQVQRAAREPLDVHAVTYVPVTCITGVVPWSAALVSTDGPFLTGDAVATVSTMNARKWVTPATATQTVKMIRARR